LIDRVFYGPLFDGTPLFHGRVIDFIDFDFFNVSIFGYNFSRFPVFNIADASVTVGVIMLLIFHKRTIEESQPTLVGAKKAEDDPTREDSGSIGQTNESTDPAK